GDNRPQARPGPGSSAATPPREIAQVPPRPAVPTPEPAPAKPVEAIPLAAQDAGAASSPTAQPADAAPPAEAAEAILESAPATDAVTPATVDDGRAPEEIWAQVQQLLSAKGTPRRNALLRNSCTPIGIEGGAFVVQTRAHLDTQQIEAKFRTAIEEALAQVLKPGISLRCVTMVEAPPQRGTPASP